MGPGEGVPKIDEDAWQNLGELPAAMKEERPRGETKQALKEDDPNAAKLKELIKLLALHINSGEDVPEPEKCPGIIAHATGMLFTRSKKPEIKPEIPQK